MWRQGGAIVSTKVKACHTAFGKFRMMVSEGFVAFGIFRIGVSERLVAFRIFRNRVPLFLMSVQQSSGGLLAVLMQLKKDELFPERVQRQLLKF